jgi:hypothetical protein
MRLPVPGPRDLLSVLERSAGSVEQLLAAAPRLVALVGDAERLMARANTLIDDIDQTRQDADEVDAMVHLIDHLPRLADKMETDIMPILDSLNSVAPDLHDLLDVSRELNEMLGQVPGISRMKKRIDKQQAEDGRG